VTYLLDTNVAIAVISDRVPKVRDAFRQAKLSGQPLVLSTITLHELWYGVGKSGNAIRNAQILRAFLAGGFAVFDFDDEDARAAGLIGGDLAKIGKPIGPLDVLIAGQAFRRNATLITANAKEFSRVPGLKWENWAN
jgi:tRNA(fMet)-specific endonuclease VapC